MHPTRIITITWAFTLLSSLEVRTRLLSQALLLDPRQFLLTNFVLILLNYLGGIISNKTVL